MVWNRRLYLFWPIFTEKTDQTTQTATMPDSSKAGSSSPPQQPPRHREIQLAWSEYKENKWQAKKTSKRTLRLDVPLAYSRGMDELDPSDANSLVFFKAELNETSDDLIIRCVNRNPPDLSQASRQAHGAMSRVQPPPPFSRVGSRGPVNMMPKGGPIPKPTPDPPPHNPVQGPPNGGSGNGGVPANNMWQTGYFRFSACSSEPTVVAFAPNSVPLVWPINAVMQHQGFRGVSAPVYFNRPFDPRWLTVPPEQREFLQLPYKPQSLYTLGGFLGASYESMYPHRDGQFFFTPFFFADDQRTYFVTRKPPVVLPPPPPPPPVIIYDRRAASVAPKAYLPSAIFDNVARYLRSDLVAAPPLVSSPASIAMTVARPAATALTSMARGDIYVPPPPVVGPPRDALQFHTFYHPYVCGFLKRLAQYGIDGLLRWDQPPAPLAPQPLQLLGADDFAKNYRPNQLVVATPYPTLEVAFDRCDAYAQYNWELFFHIPFYVANRLSQNQRFEDAMKWYHFIFDPTTDVAHDPSGRGKPACYWKLLPFQEDGTGESIDDILRALASGGEIDDPGGCEWETLAQRVADWRNDPFNPHLVARERISAYQKAVVIKYLDNLIAWGDQLFRQDTIESINQATQLYVLASEILGPRPQGVPTPPSSTVHTWNDLAGSGQLDPFSDALESRVSSAASDRPRRLRLSVLAAAAARLLRAAERAADRAIGTTSPIGSSRSGTARTSKATFNTLPLFEPPINPARSSRPGPAALDLSTAIDDVQAALPHLSLPGHVAEGERSCRRSASARRRPARGAREEGRRGTDAPARRIRRPRCCRRCARSRPPPSTRRSTASTPATAERAAIDTRQQFYASRDFMNGAEIAAITLSTASAMRCRSIASRLADRLGGGGVHSRVQFGIVGFGGSPMSTAVYGGENISAALDKAGMLGLVRAPASTSARRMASTIGGYRARARTTGTCRPRRSPIERTQADKQIVAAQIRVSRSPQRSSTTHDLQIANAQDVDDVHADKFTNQELYDWMVGQLTATYFQSYQLAFDLAQRAERAFATSSASAAIRSSSSSATGTA